MLELNLDYQHALAAYFRRDDNGVELVMVERDTDKNPYIVCELAPESKFYPVGEPVPRRECYWQRTHDSRSSALRDLFSRAGVYLDVPTDRPSTTPLIQG